jgi:hypothetical protein
MAASEIPKPVRQLIARHIDSVQQVEVLVLLRRDPEQAWTAETISRELRIAGASCAEWLDRFATAGLVKSDHLGYRDAPNGRHAAAVAELIDLYGRRRTSLIEAIYSRPSDSIQSFSDAFRLRRDD